jgi:uroporphyrinogen-III synthase
MPTSETSKKKILLTRPRLASERWARLLAAYGFEGVIEPLLTIEPTHAPRPEGAFQAVYLTSANALETEAQNLSGLLQLPCFCVGATTAAAAVAAGFTAIQRGSTDSLALAKQVVPALTNKAAPVLHIAGDLVNDKACDYFMRHGVTLTPWPVYRALAVEEMSTTTRALFVAGELAAVPVFSPRTASILVSLIEKYHLRDACAHVVAVGLSPAVAAVLAAVPWRDLRVAATPEEDAVLKCLFPLE